MTKAKKSKRLFVLKYDFIPIKELSMHWDGETVYEVAVVQKFKVKSGKDGKFIIPEAK